MSETRDRVRIAVQKSGRLAQDSLALLRRAGLVFRESRDKLFLYGESLPIDVLLVRDDDIPGLLVEGSCELGIVGRNVLDEQRAASTGIDFPLEHRALGFGHCRLALAVPDGGALARPADLAGLRIATSYPQLTAFLAAQIPAGLRRRFSGVGGNLKGSFGGWLRAQLILMLMTFFELLIGFLLLRVRGAPVIAAVTALVDALPVFGTGTVLLPWAAYCLLSGAAARGIGLLIGWGVTNLVRSCAQAKLLGDQIGLDRRASGQPIFA